MKTKIIKINIECSVNAHAPLVEQIPDMHPKLAHIAVGDIRYHTRHCPCCLRRDTAIFFTSSLSTHTADLNVKEKHEGVLHASLLSRTIHLELSHACHTRQRVRGDTGKRPIDNAAQSGNMTGV